MQKDFKFTKKQIFIFLLENKEKYFIEKHLRFTGKESYNLLYQLSITENDYFIYSENNIESLILELCTTE